MTHSQWQLLPDVVSGNNSGGTVVGFIIDSPWLPGWYGIPTIRYYSSGEDWFAANIKAVHEFPGVIFLPGFWSEFGMCTEPSAFGSKIKWNEYSLQCVARCRLQITSC